MPELGANTLGACEAADRLASGALSPSALVAACEDRIAAREPKVRAWVARDAGALAAEIARVEAIAPDHRGPLWGLPVAVKDVFDTADLPTAYGSDIYFGHRPAADAAAVARLRAAGALVLGKTVSTELAYWRAGPTRNPLGLDRSPGGSSSGSAAAVADAMVPLALGTQTAASTIRPAAYCGVVGLKPTRGLVSTAGVKALAQSFDTVGVLARRVADAALLAAVLADMPWRPASRTGASASAPPRIARWQGAEWRAASTTAIDAVEQALATLATAGAVIETSTPSAPFDGLTAAQTRLMAAEAARDLAHEARSAGDQLSEALQTLLAEGAAMTPAERMADRALIARCTADLGALFGQADCLAAPAAMDEAPRIEDGTGSPDLCRAFTALGLPSLTIPCGHGPSGLPLGLQLVARPGEDGRLLEIGLWAERMLGRGP